MEVLAESTGGPGTAQILFLLGLGLLCVILLVRSRRYFRQVTQFQVPTARPPRKPSLAKTSSAPPKDLEKWEVSMHELARELSGQLDTKIRVLELLIREANEAAERLEGVVRGQGARGKRQGASGAGRERVGPAQTKGLQSLGPPLPRESEPAKLPNASAKTFKTASNPRFERVYALADAGMSPATIANQIGSQVGEVELILSLRSTRPERDGN